MKTTVHRMNEDGENASLVAAAKAGDREALEQLVRQHQGPVFALALSRVSDASAAEEIAQDALIRACQKLDQLKELGRFAAWLRAIAIRQCALWLRSKHRESAACARMAAELTEAAAAHGEDRSLFDISRLIAGLPATLRPVAALCLEDEFAPAAAAAVLGLKPGTLRKRLHDARARLQRQIVAQAEAELRLQLLPKDFAQRCVCKCARAQEAKTRKEVRTMAEKSNCGCGCSGTAKGTTKPAPKSKPKAKK